jgi:hypothetical protein
MNVLRKTRSSLLILAGILAAGVVAFAQGRQGELRIEVRDSQGAPVAARAELVGRGNRLRQDLPLKADARCVATGIPFGSYRLSITARGFAPWIKLVEISSEEPLRISVRLGLAVVVTNVEVNDSPTLVDSHLAGTQFSIRQPEISAPVSTQPGRTISDLIAGLPGWVYEGNGVLHPRGSEYDVQYVVDGQPFTQNHSPAFAPAFNADGVESLRVITAGYPAEYGRKLGGIVEVNTEKEQRPGWHGELDVNGGAFASVGASFGISYRESGNTFTFAGDGFDTDRYLDPPVPANFTNHGSSQRFDVAYERDFPGNARLKFSMTRAVTSFLVPNSLIQQNDGQRQDIQNTETSGQLSFRRNLSPDLFLSLSGGVRDESADLSSNPLATPVLVSQDRGYREGYVRSDLAGHYGRHEWKVGVDGLFNPVREQLQYGITDPSQFDPGSQLRFQFADHRWDIESSTYAQDLIHLGNWNLSAGMRFDHYSFLLHKSAWSPRVSVSRYLPSLRLLVHGSYDRVFQTPAIENLLLASSPQLDVVNSLVARLPVQPASANFYELGITKAFSDKIRVDANLFRRDFHNYSDDDVLLDTGVSFPIAFAAARILGEEVRIDVQRWRRFSGSLSYTNQSGEAHGPVTGGLFLGSDAVAGLNNASRFRVSQDQRNTVHALLSFQAPGRVWLALGGQYGSGLPVEIEDPNRNLLLSQYGAAVFDHVNLDRGTVRPNLSLDASAGIEVYHHEQRSASLQIRLANISNRVNVINFASLFSGTAIAPPRSLSARVRTTF